MFNTKEKNERALGTKLFLKAHRCNSSKCVMTKRPHRPGLHGKDRHSSSEYGQQLNEKQKLRLSYGLREAYMRKIFANAAKNPGVTNNLIIQFLERRLDNAVFRLGLAPSRSVGRQLVSHGHILVNNAKVKAPSYLVKTKDKINIRSQSKDMALFKDLPERLKKYETPVWLRIDKDKLEGEVVSLPNDSETLFDINKVVDYYSK
ncbi:MAG: 30S ribosomal protein S4 [Candidatus Harrisonbacteria bacterium RIFCSPLOWO2_02_FULL_41_11]|uniref:Small ribosomal subunit protein uS4 n=1 Tax=Candidatus Harrisonbacteria bacterium RIFCSPHIGHO2_02_FULL_42_16 TaxID=1798404 RepID=A0A1G1ZJD7_9BACT|nr:MAG: 30S ribosomal protein S4 [Candidatus Harrisonbacteria bacterium RIFCSPHIGHO2_02_FULL_42_16]OGY66535.1 MAG: 30S ribosomal protein S4 [Candidatus Harrisonbacteria bacterium RIFCSPLOWO2_02_FULL_41_11]